MANFKLSDFKGVVPALLTLFDEQEAIDEKKTRVFVNHLISKGINGLYLTGSTGGSFLMTQKERKRVVEIVIDEVGGRVPVMVHVGAISTKKTIELAEHALEKGADAISSVPPFYWNFSEEQIINYYRDISQNVPLPMVIYNIPLAGQLGLNIIRKIADLEGVKGIKYTATTHYELTLIKEEFGPDFMVFSGCDEMALSGLISGADGIIGSFYNLMPELYIRLYQAVANNDLETASSLQKIAVQIIAYSLQYDYFSVIRLALKWMGVDAGYSRRPFKNYGPAEEAKIKEGFRALRDKHRITGVDFLNNL